MKIVHVAPNAIYDDYWGFQDNILPKYHKKLGHEVSIIVSTRIHLKDGKTKTQPGEYDLKDGTHVIRLEQKRYLLDAWSQLRFRLEALPVLRRLEPDFIFFHGLCSSTMSDCIRYQKEANRQGRKCVIVQDNHLDYNIGSKAVTLRQKLARTYHRLYNAYTQKYVEKVYGVTPWRKLYAEDYYHINPEKTDVLIMGADDEYLDLSHRQEIRSRIRRELGIGPETFLVVTGGKIDEKKNTLALMRSCAGMPGVALLIFGKPSESVQAEFQQLLAENENLRYIGWIDSNSVYDYFFAADLVAFPGQHSVLWEQACASKVPCAFQRWPGMEHVDNGGNACFWEDVSPEALRLEIEALRFTPEYTRMKDVAQSEATDIYLYSKIAQKALECWEK